MSTDEKFGSLEHVAALHVAVSQLEEEVASLKRFRHHIDSVLRPILEYSEDKLRLMWE
jgi:hypothetical protein